MPADLAQAVAHERLMHAELLDGFQREPRSVRRAISRDLARIHPVAPKRPQHGAVARWVNRPRPKPPRFDGIRAALGVEVPRSGQARVNAKREKRADFWFRFQIAADDRAEAQALADLNTRMLSLTWETAAPDAPLEA